MAGLLSDMLSVPITHVALVEKISHQSTMNERGSSRFYVI
jgi:hypothetical protein